ncbi:MAG: hypothetical protein IH840_06955 [Candidatus Heimdallarchaeota archaeon]|nr:hypothetical protein [Candidatus Heimdallarchaeota archaeon]
MTDRPAVIYFIVWVVILISFYNSVGYEAHDQNKLLFFLFALFPIFPAVFYENRILKEKNNPAQKVTLQLHVIKSFRGFFMIAGWLYSFIITIAGLFLLLLLLDPEYAIRYIEDARTPSSAKAGLIPLIIMLNIIVFLGFLIAAGFYRIQIEDYSTGDKYNLISSPSQISMFVLYFYQGSSFTYLILWGGQIPSNNTTLMYDLLPLEDVSSGTIIPFYLVTLTLCGSIIYFAGKIPHYIAGSTYTKPSRTSRMKLLLGIIVVTIVLGFASFVAMDQVSGQIPIAYRIYFHYIFIMGSGFILYKLAATHNITENICPTCNLIISREFCLSCNNNNVDNLFRLFTIRRMRKPTCPACGINWETLSRQCINCNFTIILTCQKCSNTLNPLWHKCNVCGEQRKPIPDLALQSSGSPDYARTQAYLMLLVALFVPTFIVQLTIVITEINTKGTDIEVLRPLTDDFARLVLLLICSVVGLILIMASFDERRRGVLQLLNKLVLAPGTLIIIFAAILLFVNTSQILFKPRGTFLINLALFLVAVVFLIYGVFGQIRSLLQFRPVLGFDPKMVV